MNCIPHFDNCTAIRTRITCYTEDVQQRAVTGVRDPASGEPRSVLSDQDQARQGAGRHHRHHATTYATGNHWEGKGRYKGTRFNRNQFNYLERQHNYLRFILFAGLLIYFLGKPIIHPLKHVSWSIHPALSLSWFWASMLLLRYTHRLNPHLGRNRISFIQQICPYWNTRVHGKPELLRCFNI